MPMSSGNQRLIFFFGGLAVFVALLAAGTNLFLKRIPVEPGGQPVLPPAAVEVRPERPEESEENGGRYRFSPPGTVDPRAITYTEDGFRPNTLTIRATDPIGCLITVINRSGRKIRVGVSPHREGGDPGADYGELTPGETGTYDVRYPGLSAVALHSHTHPGHGFTVVYGPGCR